ncbi:hypothetical protein [Bacillus piscicola]|uniref:hypothetical protein n=1 Tax=Bacillus piscicola TaxID=1632684 RepID=UPI001F09D4A2|nr:hypothetical protein [Bacillus piscicola]
MNNVMKKDNEEIAVLENGLFFIKLFRALVKRRYKKRIGAKVYYPQNNPND